MDNPSLPEHVQEILDELAYRLTEQSYVPIGLTEEKTSAFLEKDADRRKCEIHNARRQLEDAAALLRKNGF